MSGTSFREVKSTEATIQYHPRKLKKLSRLYSIKRQTEAIGEFWIQMEIFVPHPTFDKPIPCIFLLIQNASSRLWQRFETPELLNGFLNINEQDLQGITLALNKAKVISEEYKNAWKETQKILSETQYRDSELCV